MKNLTAQTVELDSAMVAYLEEAAQKYSLPSIGKAMRCLINYARDNPDKQGEIFDEVRCLDC